MALETQVEVGKFFSKYPELRLVRVPERHIIDSFGQKTLVQEAVRYVFRDGQMEIEAGTDVLPTGRGGEPEDALTWLRRHRGYDLDFHEVIEPTPLEEDFMRELSRATIALDDASVRELIELEEAGFKRENLLSAARNALVLVEEAQEGDGPASGEPD